VDTVLADLAALAEERAREAQVPGVAIGLLTGDRSEATGVGVADVRRGRPVGPDTVFAIASITKTMTATALASLADRGRVDLDAPVHRYAPEFALADREAASRVTVRHLLTHTGGWLGEDPPGPFDGPDALARASASGARLPQLTRPGELFSYNNAGFAVAGRVVEAAGGRPYEDEIRDLLLGPLAMTRTDFTAPADDDVAAEHTVRDGVPAVIEPWSVARSGRAIGGARSTARDLLAYARLQLRGARGVLSAERARELVTPRFSRGTPGANVALAWLVDRHGGVDLVSHGGATVTHMSTLVIVPDRQAALVSLTNGANGIAVNEALRFRFLEHLGIDVHAGEPELLALPRDALAEYAGRYEWPTSDIELAVDGDGLLMRLTWKGYVAARPPMPPFRLAFVGRDAVTRRDAASRAPLGDFIRDPSGRVRFFRWFLRARPRVS